MSAILGLDGKFLAVSTLAVVASALADTRNENV